MEAHHCAPGLRERRATPRGPSALTNRRWAQTRRAENGCLIQKNIPSNRLEAASTHCSAKPADRLRSWRRLDVNGIRPKWSPGSRSTARQRHGHSDRPFALLQQQQNNPYPGVWVLLDRCSPMRYPPGNHLVSNRNRQPLAGTSEVDQTGRDKRRDVRVSCGGGRANGAWSAVSVIETRTHAVPGAVPRRR